jgi:PAS domain S-box-containing protein
MAENETRASRNKVERPGSQGLVRRVLGHLPHGGTLPDEFWKSRHRFLLGLTWLHAALIALVGPVLGYRWDISFAAIFESGMVLHTIAEGMAVGLFAAVAAWGTGRREIQAAAVALGLMTSSAFLVHLSGGYIELHFHFFVMVAFLALYQDWVPYLLAIVFLTVHHGIFGVLWPEAVFNDAAALNEPWTWAGIHAFFILWTAAASVVAWRFNEKATAQVKLILNSVGEGIFGLDQEGKVTFVNSTAARLLGWNPVETVGRPVMQIFRHLRTDGSAFTEEDCPMFTSLREGTRQSGSDRFFARRDGTSLPVPADTNVLRPRATRFPDALLGSSEGQNSGQGYRCCF